jgi:hypothetical protein
VVRSPLDACVSAVRCTDGQEVVAAPAGAPPAPSAGSPDRATTTCSSVRARPRHAPDRPPSRVHPPRRTGGAFAARRLRFGGPVYRRTGGSRRPRPTYRWRPACTIGGNTGSGDYYLFIGTEPAPVMRPIAPQPGESSSTTYRVVRSPLDACVSAVRCTDGQEVVAAPACAPLARRLHHRRDHRIGRLLPVRRYRARPGQAPDRPPSRVRPTRSRILRPLASFWRRQSSKNPPAHRVGDEPPAGHTLAEDER